MKLMYLFCEGLDGRHDGSSLLALQALRPHDDHRVLGRRQLLEERVLPGCKVVYDVRSLAKVLVVVGEINLKLSFVIIIH